MSSSRKSLRSAIVVSTLVALTCAGLALSTKASASSLWTDALTYLPFASSNASANGDSTTAESTVQPRRTDGRRLDMSESSMLAPLVGTYNIPDYADLGAAIADLNLQGV